MFKSIIYTHKVTSLQDKFGFIYEDLYLDCTDNQIGFLTVTKVIDSIGNEKFAEHFEPLTMQLYFPYTALKASDNTGKSIY